MITRNDLFATLLDPEHVDRAVRRCTRGKATRPDIAWFLFRREQRLALLCDQLHHGTWRPAGFRRLYLRDPKPRVIARASVEDRVVHSLVALALEPVVLRSASEADYACRLGFGQHRAVLALLRLLRRHRFALHLDIRSYFPSIDPDRVRRQLDRCTRDRRLLELVERILASGRGLYDSPRARQHARMDPGWPPRGRGLPMGAVTSQLFAAHVYLQAFDHFVKRRLRVPGYVRYVDDMFLFGDRVSELRAWRAAIEEYLGDELALRLKHPDAPVLDCRDQLDGLGMRIRRDRIEPLPKAWRRFRGRAGDAVWSGRETPERVRAGVAAAAGHLLFG